MSKWSNIYRQEITNAGSVESFILHRISYKKKLVKVIRKYTPKKGKILEIGCGSGSSLAFLGSLEYTVSGIDSDPDMVKIAKEVVGFSKNRVDLRVSDILKIPHDMGFFDLIFSNGVLEHFSDDKIVKIINHCLSRSQIMIFSVPTDYFNNEHRIYGDERFLGVKYWEKILKNSDAKYLEKFGFCFKNKFIDIIYFLTRGLLPSKPPFVGFVLKK